MPAKNLSIPLQDFVSKLRVKSTDSMKTVWDPCRKKYLILTPEELLRQSLVLYFHEVCKVSYGRMITERSLIDQASGRFDLAIRGRHGTWSLLAECKSFQVALTDETILQAARYNRHLAARYILITNGYSTFAFQSMDPPLWVEEASDFIGTL